MHFADGLAAAVARTGNAVCVGFSIRRAHQLPPGLVDNNSNDRLTATANAYTRFCNGVSDVVAPLVPVVKVLGLKIGEPYIDKPLPNQ